MRYVDFTGYWKTMIVWRVINSTCDDPPPENEGKQEYKGI